jgi:hypothetical protein
MFWDNERGSFTYYSDNTMPYRFLEVVSRKYVSFNNCKEIYVVIEDEIKKKEEEKKEVKEEEEKKEVKEEKKEEVSVFAKLKSYNNSSIYSAKALKNIKEIKNINNKKLNIQVPVNKKEMIIKENANRYSYEGKIINFSFLKKKNDDKNHKISFSEYKKKHIKYE